MRWRKIKFRPEVKENKFLNSFLNLFKWFNSNVSVYVHISRINPLRCALLWHYIINCSQQRQHSFNKSSSNRCIFTRAWKSCSAAQSPHSQCLCLNIGAFYERSGHNTKYLELTRCKVTEQQREKSFWCFSVLFRVPVRQVKGLSDARTLHSNVWYVWNNRGGQ